VDSPEEKQWRDAMNYELTKLEEMNTWSEIDKSDLKKLKSCQECGFTTKKI